MPRREQPAVDHPSGLTKYKMQTHQMSTVTSSVLRNSSRKANQNTFSIRYKQVFFTLTFFEIPPHTPCAVFDDLFRNENTSH